MKKISENEIEIEDKNYKRETGYNFSCEGCNIVNCFKVNELFGGKEGESHGCYDSIWVEYTPQPSFSDLITRNYATVEKRGQLSDDAGELITKIKEEYEELDLSYLENHDFDPSEAVDVILSTCTLLQKFGYDVLTEMEKKVIFNENRED
jgi:hypothetical protein